MSLLLITNPPTTLAISSDWTTLVTRSNANMLGHGLSIPIFTLTNWDGTTTRPQIAEGSIIEVGGSFYQADADTAIVDEGGISDGTVHIKLIPGAGSPDPLTVVPTLTNDALPAWDANKAGWYTAANKYLPFEMTKASAVYTVKSEYADQNKTIKTFTDGAMTLSSSLSGITALTATTANISTANITTGNITTNNVGAQNMTSQMKWKHYYKGVGVTQAVVFTELSSWLGGTNSYMAAHMQFKSGGNEGGGGVIISKGSTTVVGVDFVDRLTVSITHANFQNGSGTIVDYIEIMSNFDAIT